VPKYIISRNAAVNNVTKVRVAGGTH